VLVALLRRRLPLLVWGAAGAAQFLGVLVIGFVTNPWPGSFTAEWSMYVGVYAVAARKSWRWTAFAVLAGTFAFFPVTAHYRCESTTIARFGPDSPRSRWRTRRRCAVQR